MKVFSSTESAIGFSSSSDFAQHHADEIRRYMAIGPRQDAIDLAIECMFDKGAASPRTRRLFARRSFERMLEDARAQEWVLGFSIVANDRCCEASADVAGFWRTADVPPMPYARCSNPDGHCMCFWNLIFETDENVIWRTDRPAA